MQRIERWSLLALFAFSFVLVGYQTEGQSDAGHDMSNACPTIERLLVSPMKVAIGEDATVSVVASDEDGDAIGYQWASSEGAFANPTAASTTYRCDSEGPQQVTVTVTDPEACESSRSARVICVD